MAAPCIAVSTALMPEPCTTEQSPASPVKEVQTCEIAATVHSPLSGSKVLAVGFKPALLAPVRLPSSSESPPSALNVMAHPWCFSSLWSPAVFSVPSLPCMAQNWVLSGPSCAQAEHWGYGKAAWLGDSKLVAVLVRKSDSLFQYTVVCWQSF